MKSVAPLGLLIAIAFLCSFSPEKQDRFGCLISFTGATNLTTAEAQQLPETPDKVRHLPTKNGIADVSRVDGYRILYNNRNWVPFVNLKVELSATEKYGADTSAVLANLSYLNTADAGTMGTKELIVLHYNGFTIHGLSRNSIEQGTFLGTFVLFPGNDMTVYIYFNNLTPKYSHFESLNDYKTQQNRFLGEYTAYIARCYRR